MATSRLPIDVKELLTSYIDSVGQLEVLLVFFNNSKTIWTPATMSQELRSHETIARQHMERLVSGGFLKKKEDDQYQYDPTLEMHSKVDLLCQTYKEMSVAVIAYIYEKPTDKLKALADAFKLKKD